MPNEPSQILSAGGRIWEIAGNLIKALRTAGGDDEAAQPLWASKELAAEIAEVLMGRGKIVGKDNRELAYEARNIEDRIKAVQDMNPYESDRPDQDWLFEIAEDKDANVRVRIEAIKAIPKDNGRSTTFAAIACDSDIKAVAEAALRRVDWVSDFYEVAKRATLREISVQAFKKLALKDDWAELERLAIELEDVALAGTATMLISDLPTLHSIFRQRPSLRPTVSKREQELATRNGGK